MRSTCLLVVATLLGNALCSSRLPEYEQCNVPLGMESGSITDHDLRVSSTHDASSVGAAMARIRSEVEGGAWCPDKPIGSSSYEYLEIELPQLFLVSAIETQGRFGNGQGREYAEFYQLQYQRENQSTDWFTYRNRMTNKTVLNGNTNTYLAEKRVLSTPVLAKRVRIIPYSSRWRTVCMRVELYGCPYDGGVTSYSTSPSIDQDETYDGGVGKLVDGTIGGADEKDWLSWNKSPVTIKFQFDLPRHFKAIHVYTGKNQYQSVEVKFDDNLAIKHHVIPVESSLSDGWVDRIPLNQYGNLFVGKRLEMRFEFNAPDLLVLTEVTFDNELATAINTTFGTPNITNCSLAVNHDSTDENSSLITFKFEWLTLIILSIVLVGFLLLLTLGACQIRRCRRRRRCHRRLRQDSNLYYKSSQMTTTTSGSCASTSSEHDGSTLPVAKKINHLFLSNKYDDVTSEQQSMGSYIYPITSTTSLLQTTPPSSVFKGEQYAVIDGNYSSNTYAQWSTNNNTFHYASSDIEQIDKTHYSPRLSLFNCIIPHEILPAKCPAHPPASVDESKLIAIQKVAESHHGEIYLGNYVLNNESQCVLIKIIRSNLVHSSRQPFLNELETLTRLDHRNLACLSGVQLDSLYLVQEHSHFGTLQDHFHTLSTHPTHDSTLQKMNIYFAYQLANALQYLSHLNLIHEDVAARNCLFYADYMIKLTDCARALPQYEHEYWKGKHGQLIPLRWMAPEALTTKTSLKSDVYSFAVTLWEIWSRCSSLPYVSLNNDELYQHLLRRSSEKQTDLPLNLSVPPDCPKEIYDLLCECWHVDGSKRPTMADIAHYFRRQIDAARVNPMSSS